MHELRARGRYVLARHVSAGPHDDRGHVFRTVTHATERNVGFPETQGDMRPDTLDLDVLAFAENTKVALCIAERIKQRRRIEH